MTQKIPERNLSLNRQRGSMLLEAMIAILVFSMGVLAIVGLQASTMKFAADAKYRSQASYLANQTLGEMWTDATKRHDFSEVIAELPGGTRAATVTGNAKDGFAVTITVQWDTPGDATKRTYVTAAEIHDR